MITIEIKSTEELLTELRPSANRWRKSRVRGFERPLWVYRGQSNANWELKPSLHRDKISEKSLIINRPNFFPEKYRYREYSLVQTFLSLSDREGILPTDFKLPETPKNEKIWWSDIEVEIPIEALNAYSLAQHHGIKTRLLDWSKSPLKAAYFAALGNWRSSNYEQKPISSHFAIWALTHIGTRQIKILNSRFSTNEYLKNQSGLFTYDPNTDLNFTNGEWISHNKLIQQDEQASDGTISTGGDFLYKIVVPSELAEEVLIALRYEGIDQASLMPSFDSIAQSVEEYLKLHSREK